MACAMSWRSAGQTKPVCCQVSFLDGTLKSDHTPHEALRRRHGFRFRALLAQLRLKLQVKNRPPCDPCQKPNRSALQQGRGGCRDRSEFKNRTVAGSTALLYLYRTAALYLYTVRSVYGFTAFEPSLFLLLYRIAIHVGSVFTDLGYSLSRPAETPPCS